MIEPLLRRFVDHKKRTQIVIILTIFAALVVILPAADEYSAASQRVRHARVQVEKSQRDLEKLPRFEELHARKTGELAKLEQRLVTDKVAQNLQTYLTQLGRQTGCTLRKARLAEPARRDWKEDDHPVTGARFVGVGVDTPYRLETRQLVLSVSGPMESLYRFLEQIHRVDQVLHSRAITIKSITDGAGEDSGTATLDMELLLFDLVRKTLES